jgi:hypothetical protein
MLYQRYVCRVPIKRSLSGEGSGRCMILWLDRGQCHPTTNGIGGRTTDVMSDGEHSVKLFEPTEQ